MAGRSKPRPVQVLFVCLGNICRSPTAECLLRARLDRDGLAGRIEVDSAGTGAWHVDERPDRRMAKAAAERGYRLDGKARQVTREDFYRFDLLIAMDRDNLADLEAMVPSNGEASQRRGRRPRAELRLFSDFLPPGSPPDVPDPYYGGQSGFERVLDLVEKGCEALIGHLLDEREEG